MGAVHNLHPPSISTAARTSDCMWVGAGHQTPSHSSRGLDVTAQTGIIGVSVYFDLYSSDPQGSARTFRMLMRLPVLKSPSSLLARVGSKIRRRASHSWLEWSSHMEDRAAQASRAAGHTRATYSANQRDLRCSSPHLQRVRQRRS
jgi:hypothetical protein